MPLTSRRVLAMPAIVAIAGLTATGPLGDGADRGDTADHGSHVAHRGHRGHHQHHLGLLVRSVGPLVDLQPATVEPFDGASAAVRIEASRTRSHTVLRVRGVQGAEGQTFGAHLHAGSCVAGDPAAALGHYNTDVLAGVVPPETSERTEVWLDFTVRRGGGIASAWVPLVPKAGARSVVIHALETDHHTGTAGARLACLPVVW